MVRRVVCRDNCDNTWLETFDNGSTVWFQTKRRIHFGIASLCQKESFRLREMLWRYFCCDLRSQTLSEFHYLDTFFLRQMLDVNMGLGCIGNHDITRNHGIFCHPCRTTDMEMVFSDVFIKPKNAVQAGIFLVKTDKGIEFFGFFHGFLDNFTTFKWNTVIRKTNSSSF